MSIFEYNEELHIKNERKIAKEEGFQQGKQEGISLGQQEQLISLICKKLEKNKSIETIADELETTVNDIQKIYDMACKYAPAYDAGLVLEEFLKSNK